MADTSPMYVVCGYNARGMWMHTGLGSWSREVAQRKSDELTKETGRVHAPELLTAITECSG